MPTAEQADLWMPMDTGGPVSHSVTVDGVQQAVSYFLDTTRMATANYFWHFLDIVRSDLGRPLLDQLAASPDKIVALLTAAPNPNQQASNPKP